MNVVWKIEGISCVPKTNEVENYVVECAWRCIANIDSFVSSVYGLCSFSIIEHQDGYTPFNQLTEQQVLGWVWSNGVDKDEVEQSLARQLDEQINPVVVQVPLPWAKE